MNTALDTPNGFLRHAVQRAYPNHPAGIDVPFAGETEEAWTAVAHWLSVTPLELTQAVSGFYGMDPAGPLNTLTPQALALIPSSYCQINNILPLRLEGNVLVVATAKPRDENLNERTRFLVNRPIRWVLAPPRDIEDAIVEAYAKEADRLSHLEHALPEFMQVEVNENAIVKLGRVLLTTAVEARASDLHIQPYLGAYVVRSRTDGELRRLTMLPDAVAAALLRHLKIRSGMDATNALIPQDGRMSMVIDQRPFDMRVSSLPASRGERLVIRFLEQDTVQRLSGSNFSHAALQTMRRALTRPSGLLVLTGPTGCGKTSTLYGMLSELNKSNVNIITVENPVEYRISGASQVEVNEKAGRTFAAALRSILRQDPDVILVGEIRDAETADIACQAALTGHLVLTSLHTTTALTAIPRLLSLGIQPTLLADSLALVMAQRLCRKLCPQCKVPVTEPLQPEERVFLEVTHNRPSFRSVGCANCHFTGYRGRLPIVDIVEMNRELRDTIALGESRLSVLEDLRDGGLKSLAASGSLRVISGDTTVNEVLKAVGPGFWHELAEHYGSMFFGDTADLLVPQVNAGQKVLLVGLQTDLVDVLTEALSQEGMPVVLASHEEAAQLELQKDEDIAFILFDLPEHLTVEEATLSLQNFQLHTSWSRLPCAVMLPPSLQLGEGQLRDSGLMGDVLRKPVSTDAVLKFIRHARAR